MGLLTLTASAQNPPRPNTFMIRSVQAGSTTDIGNLQVVDLDTGETVYMNSFSSASDATNQLNLFYWPVGGSDTADYVVNGPMTRVVSGKLRLETTGFNQNGAGGYNSHSDAEFAGTLPKNFLVTFNAVRLQWAGDFEFYLFRRQPTDAFCTFGVGGPFSTNRSPALRLDVATIAAPGNWFNDYGYYTNFVFPNAAWALQFPAPSADLETTHQLGMSLSNNVLGFYLDGTLLNSGDISRWVASSPLPPQSFLTNGLVAYYPFNGNANNLGGSNDFSGTIAGTVTLTTNRFNIANSAYKFSGISGSAINFGSPNWLNGLTNASWSWWMATTTTPSSGWVSVIRKNGSWIPMQWAQDAGVSGGNQYRTTFISGPFDFVYPSGAVQANGIWAQFCLVYDGLTLSLYKNGSLIKSQAYAAGGLFTSSYSFMVGGSEAGNENFNGLVDDIRIYKRSLSSNEVAQLYAFESDMPVITAQPQDQTVAQGGMASFSVTATAANPLTYQWFKDGVTLTSATNTTLTLTNVQPSQIGYYSVTVSNSVAGVVSANAALAVSDQDPALWRGLVAYYPFNGNANDASGNGHNGFAENTYSTTNQFGQPNSALGFAGNSWVYVPYSPSLFTTNYSVSLMFNCKTNFVGVTILRSGCASTEPFRGYGLSGANGTQDYGFADFSGTAPSATCFIPISNWQQDYWYNLIFTRNGSTAQLYLNGALIASETNTPPYAPVHSSPLYIGSQSVDPTTSDPTKPPWSFLTGIIYDARFYNRALSASEVQQLYAYESTGPVRTATASAVLSYGFVVAATISDGGYGYTNTPTVRIIGGGGSGAQAVAVVSNGVVIAVNVLTAGSGYTNTPVIVIDPPFIPNSVLGIAPMSFLAFSNLTLGGVYQLQQSVAWYWSNQPVSFTATNALYTQMVAGVANSGDYRLALNPVPAQAFATATVSYGFVVHATVTSGGSGYVTSPAITIVGGGGSNATAVANLSGGVVTSITITSPGTSYTSAPAVEIAPPPAAAVSPTALPVIRLDSANLAPYDNYQIQFKPALGETWGNWNGGLFTPTGVTNSQYLFITNGVGFFRLQYVP